jgi:hypothetical protein
MPRFHLGQKVLITGPIATKHRGREATVVSIEANKDTPPGVTSADKYIVQFEEGEEVEFYDIQLVRVPEDTQKSA